METHIMSMAYYTRKRSCQYDEIPEIIWILEVEFNSPLYFGVLNRFVTHKIVLVTSHRKV